jgi:hypothetical protein
LDRLAVGQGGPQAVSQHALAIDDRKTGKIGSGRVKPHRKGPESCQTVYAHEASKIRIISGRGTLNNDNEKLTRFLRGYVFFNHFIRVDVKLSSDMLVHAWNRGAAIMCMTNTKGINCVIPVILDTNVMFGPLHGPWEKEHIQQARQHVSYILNNSKNYASSNDQIQAAWAIKFSDKNLGEYGDTLQSDQAKEPDSYETDSHDDETLREYLDTDSQYILEDDDKLNVNIGTSDEPMQSVEMHGLEMDNVFLSLVQDFGKRRLKEPWVAVGRQLRSYTHPRGA